MLNFKEYIEEEIKKESVLSPIKFLGGFGSNIVGQGIRGAANAAVGGLETVTGAVGSLANLLAGTAYGTLGNKDAKKERLKASYENLKFAGKGLKDIVVGAIQISGAASLVTPTLRGFQAAREPLSLGFNKNRNKLQKVLGLNSNKETPYIINHVPEDLVENKKFIEEFYEQTVNKREVKISRRPEKFLKKFIVFGTKTIEKYKSKELNYKFKFLLNTYFPNFEIVEIKAGTLFNEIKSQKFSPESVISGYISYLYEKSLKDKIVIITNDDNLFISELKLIYKNYLDPKNTNNPKEEEIAKEYKERIRKIVEKFSHKKTAS